MKAAEFKAIRLKCRLSQAQFGDLLQVDRESVIRWETGISRLPGSVALLAEIMRDNLAVRLMYLARLPDS
jgi:DNA-binding transcriptional regulator YiaG